MCDWASERNLERNLHLYFEMTLEQAADYFVLLKSDGDYS